MRSPFNRFLRLTGLLLACSLLQAQQQILDDGVAFGKGRLGDAQNQSTTLDVTTVPGYAGSTDLPETQYYNNQNLTGMQTDAQNQLNNGTANDASQFAYQQSLVPKLQFAPTDPILQTADQVGTDALANPGVVTVQAGSCTTADVTQTETRLETCTAWIEASTQTCNKTLNVDVTWESISSCPIATSFSQVQAIHNSQGTDDIVYARAYCNPGIGDTLAAIQLKASDGDPGDCTDWVSAELSTDQPSTTYTGALLRPQFYSRNTCINVPAFYSGGCDANTNQCDYTVTFRELDDWDYDDNVGGDVCQYGTAMDLAAQGYTGPGERFHQAIGYSPQEGYYCVRRSTTVILKFEKPHITQTPTVTDNWNNGCAFLEAQTQ